MGISRRREMGAPGGRAVHGGVVHGHPLHRPGGAQGVELELVVREGVAGRMAGVARG